MNGQARKSRALIWTIFLIALAVMLPGQAMAHCDTESGPTAVDARKALEKSDFNIAAIWVGEEQTQKLRESFEESLAVYKMGGQAKALAERYFMTTTVRLHRQAEGMPFTELKPAQPLPPVVAKAEKTLETGNLQPINDLLATEMQKETQKWFQKALDAKKNFKGYNVGAGREWVDAYVKYVIFVNGLYKTIQAGPAHGIHE
ncbi:MAG: hypothetical protein A2X80_14255 [Geobacteraceae bacterium GWB2_52_12]|nr:MAG: hypothetical protein A2X80_14255 [Geobacteraceae bacterium GWB2_52_12]